MPHTTIGIIGAGNMGADLAQRLAAAGHTVTITARNAEHAAQAAAKAGANARAVSAAAIARNADLLLLAVPYGAAVDALRAAGDLAGTLALVERRLAPAHLHRRRQARGR